MIDSFFPCSTIYCSFWLFDGWFFFRDGKIRFSCSLFDSGNQLCHVSMASANSAIATEPPLPRSFKGVKFLPPQTHPPKKTWQTWNFDTLSEGGFLPVDVSWYQRHFSPGDPCLWGSGGLRCWKKPWNRCNESLGSSTWLESDPLGFDWSLGVPSFGGLTFKKQVILGFLVDVWLPKPWGTQ